MSVTTRKVLSVAADVATGIVAALVAVVLFGSVHVDLGPADARLSVRPALHGSTSAAFVPFGAVVANTPSAPAAWTVEVAEVRGAAFQQTFDALGGRGRLPEIRAEAVTSRLGAAARKLAVTVTVAAAVCGALFAGAIRRRMRSALVAAATAAFVCGTIYLWSAATLDAGAFENPRSTGALGVFDRIEGFNPLRPRKLDGRLGELENEGLRVVRNIVGLYYGFVRPAEGIEARRPTSTVRVLATSGVTADPDTERACRAVARQFDVAAAVDTAANPLPATPFVRKDGSTVPFVTTGSVPQTGGPSGTAVLADSTTSVDGLTVWGTARTGPSADDTAAAAAWSAQSGLSTDDPAALAVVADATAARGLAERTATVLAPGTRFDPVDDDGTRVLTIPPASAPGDLSAVCSVVYLDRTSGVVRAVDVVTLNGDSFDIDRRTFVVPATKERS